MTLVKSKTLSCLAQTTKSDKIINIIKFQEMTSLNNEDLTVVSLQFISRKVTSYSVPRSVYLHSTRIQQSVQNWVTRLCPGIIFDLSEINSRKVIKICDKDFCLVKENVNLPYVAL